MTVIHSKYGNYHTHLDYKGNFADIHSKIWKYLNI